MKIYRHVIGNRVYIVRKHISNGVTFYRTYFIELRDGGAR